MTDHVLYKGKDLGRVCLDDTNTGKFVFVANDLDSLIMLFRINPEEQIETEGMGLIPYEKFQKEYLSTISGFYPSFEAWVLKNYRAKTVAEFEASRKSE
jgi:hypothetical protein